MKRLRDFGGAEEIRTPDLCVANAALSQLSYGPMSFAVCRRRSRDLSRNLVMVRLFRLARSRACATRCARLHVLKSALRLQDPFLMDFFVDFLATVIEILIWVIIAGAIMSWLIVFNVVNLANPYVRMIYDFISRITDPLLNPIRRILPNMGGIDISPIVLILLLLFIRNALVFNAGPAIVLLVLTALSVMITIVVIGAVLTWMVALGAINMNNKFVSMIHDAITRLCDSLLNPIRSVVPRVGGLDMSFVVLIVVLFVIRYFVASAL